MRIYELFAINEDDSGGVTSAGDFATGPDMNLFTQPVKRTAKKTKKKVKKSHTSKTRIKESYNPEDVITLDVPLLIRILEFAREDAKTDMDLHTAAEKLIALCAGGKTLKMSDYEKIVPQQIREAYLSMSEVKLDPGCKVGDTVSAVNPQHTWQTNNAKFVRIGRSGLAHLKLSTPDDDGETQVAVPVGWLHRNIIK